MADNKDILMAEATEQLKVLISDDDAPTRILLRAAIAQWNYKVIETKDGEEAWEILKEKDAPRLLILDWMMPKLTGIELCERIKRELVHQPYIYIILLTQQTGTTNIIKGLDAGADEFLSKPFNMAELRSRLSVGARIVRYENQLAEKNKELNVYLEKTKELGAIESSISQLLNGSDLNQQLTALKEHHNKIIAIIDALKEAHKATT